MQDVLTAADLIAFEDEVARRFEAKEIRAPVHLSGGNEAQLIKIFKQVHADDWVFGTYRSHYIGLLHGIPRDWLMAEILAGRSMGIQSAKHRFYCSAIVGGTLSIAVGVAAALQRSGSKQKVWCFVGDMTASIGAFHDANKYAQGHALPIEFVVEDNGLSCNTPTEECWGTAPVWPPISYRYKMTKPHINTGRWIDF